MSRLIQALRPMSRAQTPLIFAPKTYQYTKGHLTEADVAGDPIAQFHAWFGDAQQQKPEGSDFIPESVSFSTARLPSGRVSSRMVLFKELDPKGFIVYSNWDTSKKNADYETNKYAALTFFWPYLQRQVRVEGLMEKVNRATTERYFNTRPRGSKIGAWTSPQSQVIASRDELMAREHEFEEKFKDVEQVPCPEKWGGMRIVPLEIEFWQGGESRLHDRLSFRREKVDDEWEVVRLAP
ncbi:pyridoxamine 5'-phosphate oxidase [Diutina rugosa]